ncbi:PEPxxWA-CTERM sorting domain-containing protein [Polymorphobacter sp. PAMC 29334]|nr:PEPxxWA-CTERM sorting domain-containing protein [Polymorphobacter sp. PAMC 29334]
MVCAALSFATAAAAVPTIYTDEAAFDAALGRTATYVFGFAGNEFSGTTYALGPVTFASDELQSYHDAYGAPSETVPYPASYGVLLTISSNTKALGLHLGSFFGVQATEYTVNGVGSTLVIAAPASTTFIGFIDSSPITATFTNVNELDTISFSTEAVPEPASWALFVAGFGLVGIVARRRRLVALSA